MSMKLLHLIVVRLVPVLIVSLFLTVAEAGPREQAKRIHDRLTGVLPETSMLDSMEDVIANNNDPIAAAYLAMQHPDFYKVTLKNFAMPWSNEEQSVFPVDMENDGRLNDYVATVIGMVRDDDDFRKILFDDVIYVGDPALSLTPYSNNSNIHYRELEQQDINLRDRLVRRNQSQLTNLPASATSGILTTRAAAKAFFIAGTNRAMFRFTMLNHLCNDMEQLKDVSRSPDRIQRDVSRSPGGDSRIYMNACIGCHSGMDPMNQAFAYYNFNSVKDGSDNEIGNLEYTPGIVQAKYNINADNFKPGYVPKDDSWINYWRQGPNSLLGWDSATLPGRGNGAKSLGQEIAYSTAFAQCQVKKVYRAVCFEDASQGVIDSITTVFRTNGYQLKRVFAEAASQCRGN